MNVVLYSTHCPKCAMLEKQLKQHNIGYTVCDDIEVMKNLGMRSAPGLQVDDKLLDFAKAWSWIKENSRTEER